MSTQQLTQQFILGLRVIFFVYFCCYQIYSLWFLFTFFVNIAKTGAVQAVQPMLYPADILHSAEYAKPQRYYAANF